MPHPTPHPKSGAYRARVAVPAHLRAFIERDHGKRTELTENLGTKERAEAIRRSRPAFEKFDRWLQAAQAEHEGQAVRLSDRDIEVLCGQWAARQEEENRHNLKGTAEEHEEAAGWLGEILAALDSQEAAVGPQRDALRATSEEIAALLAASGQSADEDSRQRLAVRLVHLKWQWHRDAEIRARSGRWKPSFTPADFPAKPIKATPAVTMDALLDGWGADRGLRRDAKPRQRAFYDRLRTVERLAMFLGHRDASKVTRADAVRVKEDMQARNLTAATIRNDLSELSAIWSWGLTNGKVTGENPFAGVSPPKAKKRAREVRPFTQAEARMVLETARKEHGVLRWLPWVCAYTGARLAEVVQSDKADVAMVSGVMCLRIHDDGGDGTRSIKNEASRRSVPIHPELAAEGFLDYVAGLPAGSVLFPDVKPDAVFGRRSETAGRMVRKWMRGLGLTDGRISPSHSWRHYFVDACRGVVMPQEIRSALTGHAGKVDESAAYGDGMKALIRVMADQLARVPGPLSHASA